MPTYEYVCQRCDHQFETIQSMRDDPLQQCPNCSQFELMRLCTGGLGFFTDEPKTLGRLGELNFSKLGHYEKEKKEAEIKANMPKPRDPVQKILNDPKKVEKYIMEGKL